MKFVLGMDIGGTNTRIGLVDENIKVRDLYVVPSREIYGHGETRENLISLIQAYLSKYLPGQSPAMVSIGFPSTVDKERRFLLSSANFPGIDGFDMIEFLESRLRIPTILEHDSYFLLENDVYINHISRDKGTHVGIYFGTGMGNSIFIDGKLYTGKHGMACELGHMPAGLSESPCSCGNYGCVEMHCCGKAFERMVEKYFPDTPIGNVYLEHPQSEHLDRFVRYMAIPISTVANILDPDYIFIGGGLIHMPGFPREKLIRHVIDHTRGPYTKQDLELIFTEDSPENGIRGAAISAFHKLKKL